MRALPVPDVVTPPSLSLSVTFLSASRCPDFVAPPSHTLASECSPAEVRAGCLECSECMEPHRCNGCTVHGIPRLLPIVVSQSLSTWDSGWHRSHLGAPMLFLRRRHFARSSMISGMCKIAIYHLLAKNVQDPARVLAKQDFNRKYVLVEDCAFFESHPEPRLPKIWGGIFHLRGRG